MSDEVEVGPIVKLSFPVMTEAGFRWGLRCPICDVPIKPGQPYASRLDSMYDNGDTTGTITCVYCDETMEER